MVNSMIAAAASVDPPGASRIVSACINLCNRITSAADMVTTNRKACTELSDLAQVMKGKLESVDVALAEEAVAKIQGFLERGLEVVTKCTMYNCTYLFSCLHWHKSVAKDLSELRSNIHVYLSMLLISPVVTTTVTIPVPSCSWYSKCENCKQLFHREQERHSKVLADHKSQSMDLLDLAVEKKGDAYERHYIFQESLAIAWGDTHSYWEKLKVPGSLSRNVAHLRQVCWLEIKGCATCHLEPGKYTLSWRLRWDEDETKVFGWVEPVSFSIQTDVIKDGIYCRTAVQPDLSCDLSIRSVGGGWKEYDVGQFTVIEREYSVTINFSMIEVTGGSWKGGLYVDAVVIQPTSSLSGIPIPRQPKRLGHRLLENLSSKKLGSQNEHVCSSSSCPSISTTCCDSPSMDTCCSCPSVDTVSCCSCPSMPTSSSCGCCSWIRRNMCADGSCDCTTGSQNQHVCRLGAQEEQGCTTTCCNSRTCNC